MGNSILWWYPDGATSPESIDLGRKVSDLQLQTVRYREDATPGWGQPKTVDQGGYRRVRIIMERMQTSQASSSIRALQTLCDSHLRGGGVFSFCLDSVKAWGSWARVEPRRGDTTLRTDGNRFTAYGTPTLAASDEFSIESPNPEYRRERLLYSSASGNVLTMTAAVVQDYQQGPVFVRYADFYPILRLAPGADEPMTHDRRLNWTLDLDCEEWPGDLAALNAGAATMLNVTNGSVMGATTLNTAASRPYTPRMWTTTTFVGGSVNPKVTK